MNKEYLIYTTLSVEILQILILLFAISLFYSTKVLRYHPGALILSICMAELANTYFYSIFYLYDLDQHRIQRIFIHEFFNYALYAFSLGSLNLSEKYFNDIGYVFMYYSGHILYCYLICFVVDIVLTIKNPFYSPSSRIKIYHISSIVSSTILWLPFELLDKFEEIQKSITMQYLKYFVHLAIPVALLFTSIYSILFSYFRMRHLPIRNKRKRRIKRKIYCYQFYGIFISILSIFQDLYELFSVLEDQHDIWLITSIIFSVANIMIIPIRLLEPDIKIYISIKFKQIICRKTVNYEERQFLNKNYYKGNTYYGLMHSALNDQLVENSLTGLSLILKMEKREMNLPKTDHLLSVSPNYTTVKLANEEDIDKLSKSVRGRSKSIKFKVKEEPITIIEYENQLFDIIRDHFEFTNDILINSLEPKFNISKIKEGEGKSGAFFLPTYDGKFLIKTISPVELKLFKSFLGRYVNHLVNPLGSLLVIILGLYTVKMKGFAPVHIILMANAFPNIQNYSLKHIFDIKGSLYKRYTKPTNKLLTLKDINLLNLLKTTSSIINISKEEKVKISKMIENDSKFLAKLKIMDYSLLLGIAPKNPKDLKKIDNSHNSHTKIDENCRRIKSLCSNYIYYFNIIDIFQEYNTKKKLENSLRTLKLSRTQGNLISAIPPKLYANSTISIRLRMKKMTFWKKTENTEIKEDAKVKTGGLLKNIQEFSGLNTAKIKENSDKLSERMGKEMKKGKAELKEGICKLLGDEEEKGEDIREKELAETLTCPITQVLEIMMDPYITKCGHAFEKSAIEQWIQKNGTCPMCNLSLQMEDLSPCFPLKQIGATIANS